MVSEAAFERRAQAGSKPAARQIGCACGLARASRNTWAALGAPLTNAAG
jgi:hypothetical protein